MLGCFKIAITGALSSGKTTVCQFFGELGAFTLSADEISKSILSSDNRIKEELTQILGKEIVTAKGNVDYQKIAESVFCSRHKLKQVEKMLHPEVYKSIQKKYEEIKKLNYKFFVVEVPLLFESSGEKFFDITVTVCADRKNRVKRFEEKGTKEQYQERMQWQLSQEEKQKRADFSIFNNGSLESLYQRVQETVLEITKKLESPS